MDNDATKHLDLLAIFHYVLSGLMAVFSCIPLFHVGFGLMIVFGKGFDEDAPSAPPAVMGWIFVIIGLLAILFGLATALLIFLSGRKIKQRRHRLFCLIIAGLECTFMPLGTLLGVFTIITLTNPEVKACFENKTGS